MKYDEARDRILGIFKGAARSALSAGDIADRLGLRGGRRKKLDGWIARMAKEGLLAREPGNRYRLPWGRDVYSGRVSFSRSGRGFVAVPGGEIVVEKDALRTALPGDRVKVVLTQGVERRGSAGRRASDRQQGRVVAIEERSERDVVGTLRRRGGKWTVIPFDPAYPQPFAVSSPERAKDGDRVIVRFSGWLQSAGRPEGRITEVIGPADDPSLDTLSVIRQYALRDEFPAPVVREAETASQRRNDPGRRVDLRDRLVITIDPLRARDFDDALSLERGRDGCLVLGVHIADVSHFVLPGTHLDREARERGTSVYFPDKVLPMLPEQLSNGECSLNPGVDRLAFSVFLRLDARGAVSGRSFAKTIIRSSARLTYEEALEHLEGGVRTGRKRPAGRAAAVVRLLHDLNAIAQNMRRRRFEGGALDLDSPECEIVMGPNGMMTDIRPVPNDISHQLVEECMIAANEAVAAEIVSRGYPVLARVHDPPKEEKLQDLECELENLGFRFGSLAGKGRLSSFLASVSNHPLGEHVKMLVLRSMNRAMYAAEERGHFGLAKAHYSHFTSPIRRYADLVMHRQLAACLAGAGRPAYSREELARLAAECTEADWRAEEAERRLVELKKYRFLAREAASGAAPARDAVVVSVAGFGVFVELQGWQMQGLVAFRDRGEQSWRGGAGGRSRRQALYSLRPGDKLKVRVLRVDEERHRIDFALVEPGME